MSGMTRETMCGPTKKGVTRQRSCATCPCRSAKACKLVAWSREILKTATVVR